MRTCHVIASMARCHGGTTAALTNLLNSIQDAGGVCSLITTIPEDELPALIASVPGVELKVILERESRLYSQILLTLNVIRELGKTRNSSLAIHLHGLWNPVLWIVGFYSILIRRVIVWSPHGMLSSVAFQRSRKRKKFIWTSFLKLFLMKSWKIMANSEMEATEILNFIDKSNVYVVPNSVRFFYPYQKKYLFPSLEFANFQRRITYKKNSTRIILFLGRVVEIKRVDLCLKAFASIEEKDSIFVIAGPVSDDYRCYLDKLIINNQIESRVYFLGHVSDLQKVFLFNNADLLMLMSYKENFGMVVPEALSFGVPVIVSDKTPWHDVKELNIGRVVSDPDIELASTVSELLLDPAMSKNKVLERAKDFLIQFSSVSVGRRYLDFLEIK